ncbi:MAG: hypothetical protein RAK18_04350 [Conexivisphaerales archaeon]|nr:hypothetical protein [Conexivisphaerales archaeon]
MSSEDDELRRLVQERSALRKQMDAALQKVGSLKEELRNVRAKLDEENSNYGKLKRRFEELREVKGSIVEELRELRGRISDLRKISRGLRVESGSDTAANLEKEIERLEWELQTKPRDEIDERRMVESLGRLTKELQLLRRAYGVRSEMDSVDKRIRDLEDRYEEVQMEIDAVKDELDRSRERLKSLLTAKRQLVQELSEAGEDLRELRDRLVQVEAQVNASRLRRREEERRRREDEESRAMGLRRSEAMKKLERNEPLSWEDLQALYASGSGSS